MASEGAAAVRAGAAGCAGQGVEFRSRRSDAGRRCEAYNHLNMQLLGALQLLCNLVAWAQPSYVRQVSS